MNNFFSVESPAVANSVKSRAERKRYGDKIDRGLGFQNESSFLHSDSRFCKQYSYLAINNFPFPGKSTTLMLEKPSSILSRAQDLRTVIYSISLFIDWFPIFQFMLA